MCEDNENKVHKITRLTGDINYVTLILDFKN